MKPSSLFFGATPRGKGEEKRERKRVIKGEEEFDEGARSKVKIRHWAQKFHKKKERGGKPVSEREKGEPFKPRRLSLPPVLDFVKRRKKEKSRREGKRIGGDEILSAGIIGKGR